MDYGKVVSRGWQIVWGNKYLILLGFLAALGSGGVGNSTVNYNIGDEDLSPRFYGDVERFFERVWPILAAVVCLLLVVAVVLWLVRLAAQAGLIGAADRIDAGEKVSLGEAVGMGTGKLGRMVGLNVVMFGPFSLLGLVAAGLGVAVAGAAIAADASGSVGDAEVLVGSLGLLLVCVGLLACLLVPLILVVNFIYPFAQRGIVLHDLGVIDGVRHGWQVLRQNFVQILLLALIFLILSLIVGAVTVAILLPLGFLAFVPTLLELFREGGSPSAGSIILLACGGVVMAVVGALINSVLVALRSATFTVAYREFTAEVES